MATYKELGLSPKEGIRIPLVSNEGEVLPFLRNEEWFWEGQTDTPVAIAIPIQGKVPMWFFDDDESRFTVGTDDKRTFQCRYIVRSKIKGLHFTRGIAKVKTYFQHRLEVPDNRSIGYNDFCRYGEYRNDPTAFWLFRLDETVYFLDYSCDAVIAEEAQPFATENIVLEQAKMPYAAKRAREIAVENNWPYYPQILKGQEPVPDLPYWTDEIVVVRRKLTPDGVRYQVVVERKHNAHALAAGG